jgi:hypothetical protein
MCTISIETITPKKAEQWLSVNTTNRKLREGVAERYAADMKGGKWTQCITPIAFYEDGELADGQHRLWAIVESGMTVQFPVMRGLSRDDGLNIDTGLNRTLVDNAKIAGSSERPLSHHLIAVVKAIETGGKCGTGAFTHAQTLELIERHYEAANWALHHGPRKRGMRNACTLAAIARAYWHERDLARLEQYGAVLDQGFANGEEDSAAVAMRNYLIEKGAYLMRGPLWADTFKKVQNSLRYFMQRKRLTVIKGVAEEVYPLVPVPAPGTLRRARRA